MVSLESLIGPRIRTPVTVESGQQGAELLFQETENPYAAPVHRALPTEKPSSETLRALPVVTLISG